MATTQPCARIGILGGTFDPIHIGHLILADEARARLDLDRVILVPARHSPLKGQDTLYSADERCDMVSLAIKDNPSFGVSRLDVDRDGPSYTVETLQLLHQQYGPAARLWFIMGMDSLQTFDRWRRPDEIIRLARLAVLTRPGSHINMDSLDQNVPGISQAVDMITTLEIGISSTSIRQRIAAGSPYRYLVPGPVARYINAHPRVRGTTP